MKEIRVLFLQVARQLSVLDPLLRSLFVQYGCIESIINLLPALYTSFSAEYLQNLAVQQVVQVNNKGGNGWMMLATEARNIHSVHFRDSVAKIYLIG